MGKLIGSAGAIGISLLAAVSASCSRPSAIAASGAAEVAKNIFDNGASTAYLAVDRETEEYDVAIADLIQKKEAWMRRFPKRRIMAMAFAYGGGEAESHPLLIGILIHYEAE